MTFLEAIRRSEWVRRRGWPAWIVVTQGPRHVTIGHDTQVYHADLLAEDWECYSVLPDVISDEQVLRFSLIEIDAEGKD